MNGLVDQEVRDAACNDLDTSFFLEAGAGTGKTTVLVSRVMRIVTSGSAGIAQVVVLTFTEKAAAELRDRIRDELHREIAEGDPSGHAKRALHELDAAHIETIHAFASSVLREHPIQSGIDPNFTQLDEVAGDVDFDDRWESWLWSEEPTATAVLRRCVDLGLRIDDDLRGVAKNFATHREIEPRLTRSPVPDVEQPIRRLTSLLQDAQELAGFCTKETDRSLSSLQRFERDFQQVAAAEAADREALLFRLAVRAVRGGQANWTNQDARERMVVTLEAMASELDDFKQALRQSLTGEAAQVLWDFATTTSRERMAEGLLTFDDLLIEASKLVREHAEVRRRLSRRYRFFLIDEFQDTDPLQAEMIFRLAAQEAGDQSGQWSELPIIPGRLFLVGDPKQSIYRFRRADIAVYMTARESFLRMQSGRAGARVESLVQNFRSVPRIVEWVNGVFSQTMRPIEGLFGAQPEYQPIDSARTDVGRGVVHLYPNVPIEDERLPAVRGAEARAIAKMILALVLRDDQPVERDEVGPLKLRFRDICLLVDTRTDIERYTGALAAAGIPYITDSGNLFERQEIRDVAAILRALDDPSDMTSLVAALKSEAFSCSDKELLQYKVQGGTFTLFAPPIDGDPVSTALAKLRELYDLKADMGMPSFVDLVIRESFLVEALLLSAEEQQRAANLKLISQRAREFSEKGMDSLRPFIRWVSSRQFQRPRESESQMAENEDDVVRVMTIHGAKGLEFPVVFLAKMAGAPWDEQPQYIVNRDRGVLEFRVGRRDNRFSTPGFDAAWEDEQRFQEAEQYRKLYVAATRACDYLVVPVFRPEANLGAFARLPAVPDPQVVRGQSSLGRLPGADVMLDSQIPPKSVSRLAPPPLPTDLAQRWIARRARLASLVQQGVSFVVPSELGHDTSKQPFETEPLDWDEPEFDLDLESESGVALGSGSGAEGVSFSGSRQARERGVLVHEVLYRADFSYPQVGADWVKRVCEGRGVPELQAEVSAHVDRVLGSETVARVQVAKTVLKEVPVITFDGERYVEGIVDLLFEEADGWVLVDYKTDTFPAAEIDAVVDRYRPQVGAYADALKRSGIHVKQVCLWLTATGLLYPI